MKVVCINGEKCKYSDCEHKFPHDDDGYCMLYGTTCTHISYFEYKVKEILSKEKENETI